jgi:hypothetical protein
VPQDCVPHHEFANMSAENDALTFLLNQQDQQVVSHAEITSNLIRL